MMISEVVVHAFPLGETTPVPAAKIEFTDSNETVGLIRFRYGKNWRSLKTAYPFDPVRLPLTDQVFVGRGIHGIFGAIGDAMPDQWGLRVLDYLNNGKPLSLPEILVGSSQEFHIGSLRFSDQLTIPNNPHLALDIEDLYQIANSIERKSQLPGRLRIYVADSSGLGGARPKGNTIKDDRQWIVKFPSREDMRDQGLVEYCTMKLARECGIDTPETELVKMGESHALLVERFDRYESCKRHYLSMATVCGLEPGNDRKSYPLLADEMRRICKDHKQDARQLFRRMIFNILVSNHDDHAKNHGLILREEGYSLAPAFDVVAGEGTRRDQAVTVGSHGTLSTLDNALSECGRFTLSKDEALSLISELSQIVSDWTQLFLSWGMSTNEIDNLRWAMMPKSALNGIVNRGKKRSGLSQNISFEP